MAPLVTRRRRGLLLPLLPLLLLPVACAAQANGAGAQETAWAQPEASGKTLFTADRSTDGEAASDESKKRAEGASSTRESPSRLLTQLYPPCTNLDRPVGFPNSGQLVPLA